MRALSTLASRRENIHELVAGKVEGSYLAPGSGVVRKANARVKIRFLSLKQNPENAKTISKVAPGAFYTVVKPAKRMPSN